MKKSILCSIVALACALGLSACGGNDDGELQLAVGLSGVTETGLTISNKGSTPIAVEPGSVYVFPVLVPVDSDYDITVVGRPENTESCVVNNGKGNTGSFSPQNISIVCVIKTYDLGGTVTGLTEDGLVVNNGAQSVRIAKDATTFKMSTPTTANPNPKLGQVAAGVPYGLTILAQPNGLTCEITKGIKKEKPNGLMPAAAVTDIAITCTKTKIPENT